MNRELETNCEQLIILQGNSRNKTLPKGCHLSSLLLWWDYQKRLDYTLSESHSNDVSL